MFTEPAAENGLAYASLGLLCFGPSKERNPVWERLVEETQQRLDKQLLHRSDYDNHWQSFNVAKAVARFSLGLSKKDETSRLIERMVERIGQTSSSGFFDDATTGLGGNFNLYGVMTFVFIRSALQLHANSGVRDRKLPTLRTYAEKYIKMMPDLPTVSEAGVPGYDATIWLGIMAPKGTPNAIVDRLNAEIIKAIAAPAMKEAWAKQGAVPITMTPAEFGVYLDKDIAKWADVIKKADIKLQ